MNQFELPKVCRFTSIVSFKSSMIVVLAVCIGISGCSKSAANAITLVVLGPIYGAVHAYEEIFSDESSADIYCKREDGTVFYYSVFKTCIKESYTEITKEEYLYIKNIVSDSSFEDNNEVLGSDSQSYNEEVIEDKIKRISEMEKDGLITTDEATAKRTKLVDEYINR